MSSNKCINIMTSCDQNLVRQVPVLLESISNNITTYPVNFYLFYSEISRDYISLLHKQCSCYDNVTFYEIKIPNPDDYEKLSRYGGRWGGEAYYSCCAHELLPDSVDRVLYLDAGDVMVVNNIDDFYFQDFENHSIIATCISYKIVNNQLLKYEADDLCNPEYLPRILRGIFNSGSYIMNLEKLRVDGYSMNDYLYLSSKLAETMGEDTNDIYWGDQGFLSAAFVGDIKYHGYPQIANIWFMPYNFCVWYFDGMDTLPSYTPCIVHFAGTAFKPWNGNYPIFVKEFQDKARLRNLKELKIGQAEYFYMWHEYAIKAAELLKML